MFVSLTFTPLQLIIGVPIFCKIQEKVTPLPFPQNTIFFREFNSPHLLRPTPPIYLYNCTETFAK